MDEALGIILRLFTETEPITYEGDWFTLNNARVHLRPYTIHTCRLPSRPCSLPPGRRRPASTGSAYSASACLAEAIEETALRESGRLTETGGGRTRENSRPQRVAPCRSASTCPTPGTRLSPRLAWALEVTSTTTSRRPWARPAYDGPADQIIDDMAERGSWCIGTPDDLIAKIRPARAAEWRLWRLPSPGERVGHA